MQTVLAAAAHLLLAEVGGRRKRAIERDTETQPVDLTKDAGFGCHS
ncbi:hypothetical protein C4D60_Mb06t37230 [Musa balbisiana]|uniref:Uncharacterized protein n=1 Tax=Musa balbisiana TaxID=52838 RepID=A0A4S8ITG7_MUSBA|nr:hypothetical protein C4D60_Mb06t37230 [Musa balbisiana]